MERSTGSTHLRRLLTAVATVAVAAALARPVAAHGGSAHRSVPHWLFLGFIVVGLGAVASTVTLSRRRWVSTPKRTIAGVFAGAVLVVVGTIALVEFQVEPLSTDATPIPRSAFPAVSFGAGIAIVLASVGVGLLRWPDRPIYIALGSALGLYVAYPVLVPGIAVLHPAGYALFVGVVALVGYVLWREVVPALGQTDRLSRLTGLGATVLFLVFALFSTGQLTLNPDPGARGLSGPFVVAAEFANPLVMWPAVEFYFPSIPLFGAMSVGTFVMFGLLGTLVGVNTVLATRLWLSDDGVADSRTTLGTVMTAGATACCCCAPAVYGIAAAFLGLSASPLYWLFLDSSSPLGSLFFVGAVALMTASAVSLATRLEETVACTPAALSARGDLG